jgi:hypothetical protein
MHHLALLFALATLSAACSSVSGSCSTAPPGAPCEEAVDGSARFDIASDGPQDVGPLPCNGLCGPGTTCDGTRCIATDVGGGDATSEPAPSDVSSPEAAVDVAIADIPAEAMTDAARDALVDVSDAPTEAATPDALTDAAPDAPVMCGERPLRCTTNADCAVCIRSASGEAWCCRTTNNECAVRIGTAVCE